MLNFSQKHPYLGSQVDPSNKIRLEAARGYPGSWIEKS